MRENVQKVMLSLLSRLGTGKTGLVLLPAVTGMGKSYSAEKLILGQLLQSKDMRKWNHIFFITPRKDNLPTSLLQSHNPKKQKSVVFVNQLQENFVKNWSEARDAIEKLELDIDSKIIAQLHNHIQLLIQQQKNLIYDQSLQTLFSENFSKFERDFRRSVKAALKTKLRKDFSTLSTKAMFDPQYQWISKLYPAQIIEEADVIIMSAKMSIVSLVRIDGSARLSDFLEGSLVILDEFDSIKSVMLDNVVEEAEKNRYKLVRNLRKLIGGLTTIDSPDIFPESIKCVWNDLLTDMNKFYTDNLLWWPVKLNPELNDASRRFMASDYQFTTYIKGNERINLILKTDTEKGVHVISKPKDSPKDEDDQSLISFLVGCRILIDRVAYMFRNATEIKSREMGKNFDFVFEDYFYSICNHFSLDLETIHCLLQIVQKSIYSPSQCIELFGSRTFIQKGLQLIEITDGIRNPTHSVFQETSLNPVPEAILLDWCNKAQVLGMSATALRETAIGNFHLDSIRSNLGEDRFLIPNEAEHKLLKQLHTELFEGYETGVVTVQVIQTDLHVLNNDPDSRCIEVVGCELKVRRILRQLIGEANLKPTKDSSFLISRYLRIVFSFCHFRDHPEIFSSLFILNVLPKNTPDSSMSLDVINNICIEIFGADSNVYVSVLQAKGFAAELKKIDEALLEGKRIIAFSTYATIGKGVNLQHSIPPSFKMVYSNKYTKGDLMDWQMIHLDSPTNLLPSLQHGEPFGKDNLKALMQFEYLVLCGALPYNKTGAYFSSIFQNKAYEHPQHMELFNFTIREVIQALGRVSRTNVKGPVVYIMVEEKLLEIIRYDPLLNDLVIPEYKKLLEIAQSKVGELNKSYFESNLCNNALNITLESEKKKQNLLTGIFKGNVNSIETYKLLRETLLKNPVTSDIDTIPSSLQSAYIRLPESLFNKPVVYFSKRGDRVIDMSFQYNSKLSLLLSEISSGLGRIVSFPYIRQFFVDQQYATSFGSGTWIFNPSLFDMYKGALGEAAGKFLLENACGIRLKELPDKSFEQFDFLLSSNEKIAVDFKMFLVFNSMSNKEHTARLKIIADKRKMLELEKVFLINILAETDNEEFSVATFPEFQGVYLIPFILKGNSIEPKAIDFITKELN